MHWIAFKANGLVVFGSVLSNSSGGDIPAPLCFDAEQELPDRRLPCNSIIPTLSKSMASRPATRRARATSNRRSKSLVTCWAYEQKQIPSPGGRHCPDRSWGRLVRVWTQARLAAMRGNMAANADVVGRLTVDGVKVEYRARLLEGGTVNVGTLFPVK